MARAIWITKEEISSQKHIRPPGNGRLFLGPRTAKALRDPRVAVFVQSRLLDIPYLSGLYLVWKRE